jgi:hypothetical protein
MQDGIIGFFIVSMYLEYGDCFPAGQVLDSCALTEHLPHPVRTDFTVVARCMGCGRLEAVSFSSALRWISFWGGLIDG